MVGYVSLTMSVSYTVSYYVTNLENEKTKTENSISVCHLFLQRLQQMMYLNLQRGPKEVTQALYSLSKLPSTEGMYF